MEAACVFHSPSSHRSSSKKKKRTGEKEAVDMDALAEEVEGRGDHIRIYIDAGVALRFRALLAVLSVEGVRTQRGESLGDGQVEDPIKFMGDVGLVWVDEAGKAVLVA